MNPGGKKENHMIGFSYTVVLLDLSAGKVPRYKIVGSF